MKPEEYIQYDGIGLAELVHKGEVSRRELIDVAIVLVEKHNPQINAICHIAADQARAVADLADAGTNRNLLFDGVPFLLKDLASAYEGWPERMASRAYCNRVNDHTDTLTSRYLAAGLNIFGRTTTPEFGAIGVTESALYGDTRNPWELNHTPGGSSGGAAASVAAGIVPFAHASDGGGSIRNPASCTGLVGLKPSRGRNPTGPIVGEVAAGLGVGHVVSRSLRDSAAALDATSGAESGDLYSTPPVAGSFLEAVTRPPPPLRIAFCSRYWSDNSPTHFECVQAVKDTIKLLTDLGHEAEDARPLFDYPAFMASFDKLWASIAAQRMRIAKTEGKDNFEPFYRELASFGRTISAVDILAVREHLFGIARISGRFHETYDVLVTPVLGIPPLRIGEWDRSAWFSPGSRTAQTTVCTPVANVTGQPALSLPLHTSTDGLPVGVMFTAAYGREDLLFQLAGQIEQAAPWCRRHPPQHWG